MLLFKWNNDHKVTIYKRNAPLHLLHKTARYIYNWHNKCYFL